jgi:hypothetical protein
LNNNDDNVSNINININEVELKKEENYINEELKEIKLNDDI